MTRPPAPGDHLVWTDPRGRDHQADVIAYDSNNRLVIVIDERVPATVDPAELH